MQIDTDQKRDSLQSPGSVGHLRQLPTVTPDRFSSIEKYEKMLSRRYECTLDHADILPPFLFPTKTLEQQAEDCRGCSTPSFMMDTIRL